MVIYLIQIWNVLILIWSSRTMRRWHEHYVRKINHNLVSHEAAWPVLPFIFLTEAEVGHSTRAWLIFSHIFVLALFPQFSLIQKSINLRLQNLFSRFSTMDVCFFLSQFWLARLLFLDTQHGETISPLHKHCEALTKCCMFYEMIPCSSKLYWEYRHNPIHG